MARAAASLFAPPAPSRSAPTTNLEGQPAFNRPPKEQLLQTLLTNTLGAMYYETKDQLVADTYRVHTEALADPAFMGRALGYARERGFMRTQPIYGLARLASHPNGEHFERAFSSVIKTPNDLIDFASIVKSLRGGEGGRRIKRVAGRWLLDNINEYWAIKYGSEKKAYALRDLFRAYHPYNYAKPNPVVTYLLRGGVESTGLTQINAFGLLKVADNDADKIAAITAGRLPHEVATSFAGTSKTVWEAIIPNMPLFALLRNLATLERHGVLDAAKERIESLFGNASAVAKSKVFPFRFLEASKHVKAGWAQDACRIALEHSFANAESIEGTTAIALDVSGSMNAYIQMAAIFGISAARRAPGSKFFVFNEQIGEVQISKLDSVLTQASNIHASGGTATELVPKALLHTRERVDNIILITDEQQNMGRPFMDRVAEYRSKYSPQCKVFVLNVAPYTGGALLDSNEPKNFYVYGLTEAALNFIAYASRGWGKFVEYVTNGEQN